MSGRSFADFKFRQKLRVGFCGESFRAVDGSGGEVRITVIEPALASNSYFAAALTRYGEPLSTLGHENLVTTRQIGRASDGSLVVVSDAIPSRVDVAELLADAGSSGLPQEIAASIGYYLVSGLAVIHGAGVIHGAIHPRCVVIDVDGTVKLSELGIGRALAQAGARTMKATLIDKVGGHLAPEVRRGGTQPSQSGDVFAAAAVVFQMLSGTLPPGTLDISPGFERMIQRALDPDVSRRYSGGTELFENFAEALEDDNWLRATPGELATYVMEAQSRVRGDVDQPSGAAALDEATEDLLSILEPGPGTAAAGPAGAGPLRSAPGSRSSAGAGSIRLDSGESEFAIPPETLDSGPRLRTGSTPFSARRDSSGLPLLRDDDSLAEPSAESDPPTRVDPLPLGPKDPISELIALSGAGSRRAQTPLPSLTTAPAPGAIPAPAAGRASPARGNTDDFLDSLSQDIEAQIGGPSALGSRAKTPQPTAYSPHARPDSLGDPLDALPPLADVPIPDVLPARPSPRQPARSRPAPVAPAVSRAPEFVESDLDILSAEPVPSSAPASAPDIVPFTSRPAMAAPAAEALPDPLDGLDPAAAQASPGRAASPVPDADAPPRRAAASPEIVAPDLQLDDVSLGGGGSLIRSMLWIIAALGAVGVLVWVVMGQSQMRDAAQQRADRQEEENQRRLDEHRNAQPKPGTLIISSQPGDAAVWMELGRTPVDTSLLPTDMPHELRLELDGYKTEDVRVVAMHWKGEGNNQRAEIQVALKAGKDKKPVPAYPPAEPPSAREGLTEGAGVIHIESSPQGAQVWLLVGYTTPSARYTGAEVDRAYEFKILRDGFLPGFVEIKAHDWKKSVDPTELSRSVELAPRKGR